MPKRARRRVLSVLAIAIAAGAVLAGCATGSETSAPAKTDSGKVYKLSFATYLGAKSPALGRSLAWWQKDLEKISKGRIKFTSYYDGALLPATDLLAGTADGRADITYTSASYTPGQLPLSGIAGIPFMTSNYVASTDAFNSLNKEGSPLSDEYAKQGVHVLSFVASDEEIVSTKTPINSLSDLSGKKIRTLGYASQAVNAIGADPVSLALNDVYQSLDRGVINGYTGMTLEAIPAFSLQDVAPNVYSTGFGQYQLGTLIINSDIYKSLPRDLKSVVEKSLADFREHFYADLKASSAESCKVVLAKGGVVKPFSAKMQSQWKKAIGNTIVNQWKSDVAATGGTASSSFYNSYVDALAKASKADTGSVDAVTACAKQSD